MRRFPKKLCLLGLMCYCVSLAYAQYGASFSQYWALRSFYNPAATARDGLLDVQGAYSMQMMGYEDAPATMYAGVDVPVYFLSPRHGAGVGFLNDEAGLFSHKRIHLQYAYHLPLGKGFLSGGLRLGMISQGFDGSGVDLGESGDPSFPTSEVSGAGFDLDFGLEYRRKNWYAGFSMMHCTMPTIELGDEKLQTISIPAVYYLTGGYNIQFENPLYQIQTSAMMRTDFIGYRGDVTARLLYTGSKFHFYGGLSYSPLNSVSFLLGGKVYGVTLGYSYEMYTSGIGALNGSHELTLGYQIDLNLFKKGKNKHKSIRIL